MNKSLAQLFILHDEKHFQNGLRFGTRRLTVFCGCTARFVSDQIGNPADNSFSHDANRQLTVCILFFQCSPDTSDRR